MVSRRVRSGQQRDEDARRRWSSSGSIDFAAEDERAATAQSQLKSHVRRLPHAGNNLGLGSGQPISLATVSPVLLLDDDLDETNVP